MKKKYLDYARINDSCLAIKFAKNRKPLGELIRLEDGTWHWWVQDVSGCFPGYILKEIVNKLNELNRKEAGPA